jgi:pyrimidine-nucleoside phosphorylase
VTAPTFEELIEAKRDGHEHEPEDVKRIITDYTAGCVPDYQMSAWLMAALLRGLSAAETIAMTEAMIATGDIVDLSSVPGVKVDKHSTGGVADTTTLVLAPLVAACGVPVAKMSGRGLGHTGGTLDKLESIPGFRTELSEDEFVDQLGRIGVALMAQSPSVDPADKKIYALRDATGTVPSIPLIVSSIMSKKVAGGADAIVLDVKVGSGAFMKTEAEARQLAHELGAVGDALGRKTVCFMSDMSQPLGMAVGNALEVAEAIQTLKGEGPASLTELCLALGARMLVLGGASPDERSAVLRLRAAIDDGSAIRTFREWVEAQGGDGRVADDVTLLPHSACVRDVHSLGGGWIEGFDAAEIGRAAMMLGAGRERVGDAIDPGAGIILAARIGDLVEPGQVLATMHAASPALIDAAEQRFLRAVHLGTSRVVPPPLFHEL